MKKATLLLAIAALFVVSCQVETLPTEEVKTNENRLTFRASIEQPNDPVKGAINASNQLVWAENDLIGIYFPDWGDKNQPFRLDPADAGNTSGSFTIATAANPSGASATAAYFPYQYTDEASPGVPNYPTIDQNNVYNGVAYFKLLNSYWSYNSGDMLTPLVAPITSASDNISFKHAGAAVKLTINNLVSGTYHTKMSVTGKQITGGFHVNPANAGTEALALDAAEDASKNNVTLHSWKSSGAFTWIFPVPELTKPQLQFEITDNNGVTVWSASLKPQANDVTRGKILVMPALSITPYSQFTQDDACEWSFSGNINGSSWHDNVPMVKDGKYWILSEFTFAAGDEFKIRKDKKWDEAYPGSNWVFNDGNKGKKDIIFNSETHDISVVDHVFPYPTVKVSDITIDGSFTDWELVPGETNGNTTVKITSDNTYLYVYVQRTNASGDYDAIWGGGGYVYIRLDYDNDWDTDGAGNIWDNKGDLVALLYPYAGTSGSPAFNTTATGSWQASPSPSTVANVTLAGTETSGTATFECRIPREDIPTVPTTTIAVKVSGNQGMSGATFSRKL